MSTKIEGAQSTVIDPPEWLEREYFPFQNRRIEVQGHQIHYIDEGQGPILLLLHGNGSWSYGFRHTIPLLTPHFRVITLDYPGMGLSEPKSGFSYLPEDHSHAVEAFIDALNLHDITLCVEDWGGPIGLGVAGRRPERFTSLVITNTWAWPAQDSPNLARFSNLAGSLVGRFLITRFNLLSRVAVPNTSFSRKMDTAELQGYWLPYQTVQSRTAQSIFPREILNSHVYLSQVEAGLKQLVNKPVLILWGEKDPAFGEAELERWSRIFSDATVVRLPEAKHFVQVDEPEMVAKEIAQFAI